MEQVAWAAVGVLAAVSLGTVAMFLGLTGRIDSINGRIDAINDRVDALGARLDARLDGVSSLLQAHVERHAS